MVAMEVNDLRSRFVGICYNPNFESLKPAYMERLVVSLQRFNEFYGNDKRWICGEHITFADFLLYEILSCQKALDSQVLKDFPRLESYCQSIEALPELQDFFKSTRFNVPLNNKVATFGGKLW